MPEMPESPRNLSRKHSPRGADPRVGSEAHKARQRDAMRRKRAGPMKALDDMLRFGAAWQIAEIFAAAQVRPAKPVFSSHVYEND